jgi:uncharacterized membrane protein
MSLKSVSSNLCIILGSIATAVDQRSLLRAAIAMNFFSNATFIAPVIFHILTSVFAVAVIVITELTPRKEYVREFVICGGAALIFILSPRVVLDFGGGCIHLLSFVVSEFTNRLMTH